VIRFHWRPLIPGETDPELLWGSVLLLTSFLTAGWLCGGWPTPLCPLHALTGIPCPTCGMTRGVESLLHGDPRSAFLFNPLGIILLLGMALYLAYAVIVVAARLPRLRWEPLTKSQSLFLRWMAALLIAGNWAYLICHAYVMRSK
jgi:hypothetical protein